MGENSPNLVTLLVAYPSSMTVNKAASVSVFRHIS
jgi:hypothetical protein